MKRNVALYIVLTAAICLYSQEMFTPGKIAILEIPLHVPVQGTMEQQVPGVQINPEKPQVCYIKSISAIKKQNGNFIRIQFIPWLSGENILPELTVNNEKIPASSVLADINKKALYVPHPKTLESHEGLYIRLFLLMVFIILSIGGLCFLLVKRKVIVSTLRLFIILMKEQYQLTYTISRLSYNNWRELEHCIRRYCDCITRALSSHDSYKNCIDHVPAKSFTAQEIALQKNIPLVFKQTVVTLLNCIEQARWQNKEEDFTFCSNTAKELPGLIMQVVNKDTKTS